MSYPIEPSRQLRRQREKRSRRAPVLKRRSVSALLVAVLVLIAIATTVAHRPTVATAASADGSPNVVLVMTDDQRAGTTYWMPEVRAGLQQPGTRFSHLVIPTSTCCPSRASTLTGLFAHDTGVYGNGSPDGGWSTFFANGNEERTIATALHDGGYRTGLFGKYLNGFAQADNGAKVDHVPPGWTRFLTFKSTTAAYYDYRLSDDSVYGSRPRDYSTDVLAQRARDFIRGTASDQPVFVMLTPFAPHAPYTPAPRDVDTFIGKLPSYHPPSVTEDVSDKPPYITGRPRVSQYAIDRARRLQVETLQSVDDAVGTLLRTLTETGRMTNTLFIYTSDNGLMWGDHHTRGKYVPYRFASDVPLIMRWDGHIPAGAVDRRMALNLDIPATIAAAAGVSMPSSGKDLRGSDRRGSVLLEARTSQQVDGGAMHPAYCGLRSSSRLFVHYADGFEELYDYTMDPYETQNQASNPAYAGVVESMRATAAARCLPVPPGFTWGGP
jgi:arylsulfatase A-like enzyme